MTATELQQELRKLSDFFRVSPLVGADIDLMRDRSPWRENQFLNEDDSDTRDDSRTARKPD